MKFMTAEELKKRLSFSAEGPDSCMITYGHPFFQETLDSWMKNRVRIEWVDDDKTVSCYPEIDSGEPFKMTMEEYQLI